MSRRRLGFVAPLLATVALIAASLVPGLSAGATPRSPIRYVGHSRALRDIAAVQRSAPSHGTATGADAFESEWLRTHSIEGEEPEGGEAVRMGEVAAPVGAGNASVATTGYGLVASWQGSNHFDSRYSDNGNQFSGEPPDQGLCANNSRVFEIVNSVVQVYTTSGTALLAGDPFFPGSGPVGITLAQFFGLPPEFQRPDGPFGPTSFDVSCLYDGSVGRWFVTSEYLDLDPTTGDYTGTGGFRIAVSDSSDPLGTWTQWDVRTMNNGTEGTPDHQCSSGFCYGDYPQLGVDANGVYVTTNEFDFFNGEFHGAQLYAFSKADLVAGDAAPTSQTFESVESGAVQDLAYTLQPVNARPADFVRAHSGTMYFGMSQSPFVDGNADAVSLWRLTNTASLNAATPALALGETSVPTGPYTFGVHAEQAPGPTPLLSCANKFKCIGTPYPHQKSPLPLDGGSGKIYGAWLRIGVVYLTTASAVQGPGGAEYFRKNVKWRSISLHDGVAWMALMPSTTSTAVTSVNGGILDVPGANLTYPSVAMNADGEGAIGATLVGPNLHPSAVYIPFTTAGPTAQVQVAGLGIGPNDGFTGTGEGGYRTRWGDYGAAAVAPDGTVWLANEYIAQRCTPAVFNADPTCGFTRTFYANWSTRITAYDPE